MTLPEPDPKRLTSTRTILRTSKTLMISTVSFKTKTYLFCYIASGSDDDPSDQYVQTETIFIKMSG